MLLWAVDRPKVKMINLGVWHFYDYIELNFLEQIDLV